MDANAQYRTDVSTSNNSHTAAIGKHEYYSVGLEKHQYYSFGILDVRRLRTIHNMREFSAEARASSEISRVLFCSANPSVSTRVGSEHCSAFRQQWSDVQTSVQI